MGGCAFVAASHFITVTDDVGKRSDRRCEAQERCRPFRGALVHARVFEHVGEHETDFLLDDFKRVFGGDFVILREALRPIGARPRGDPRRKPAFRQRAKALP